MSTRARSIRGLTLIEAITTLAVVGIATAMAAPSMGRWATNQRLSDSARVAASALSYARTEAIRTGNIFAVFFQNDANGNPLSSPIVVLDDGAPGSSNQNCDIDTGEPTVAFQLDSEVAFGVALATNKVSTDPGGGTFPGNSTFLDAGSNPASWVLFRPEGTPLAFSSDCSLGAIGSGGGGVYFNNGVRDAAVVLSPLGAARVHGFAGGGGTWTE